MRSLISLVLLVTAAPASAQEVSVAVAAGAHGTRTMRHELVVPGDIRAVWQAVATIDGWRTWAVPVARPVPGTDRFETNYDASALLGAPSGIEQQWIARKVPYLASFRTTRTPTGFPHADTYKQVVNIITLTRAGRRATRVLLTATGYPAGPEGDALIGIFRKDNVIALRQLHKRFASGPIDWNASDKNQKGE